MQQYETLKSKRRRNSIIGYSVMAVLVAAISTICIMLVLGYRFDGKVERGALLQFDSFPSGATIELDGKRLGFQTAGKQNTTVGSHNVTFSRNGYRNWSKQAALTAGEVRWLSYARLVPTDIQTSKVREFDTLGTQLPSPDRRYIAVLANETVPALTFADIRDNKKPVFSELTIPENLLTRPDGATHKYEIIEWNFGVSHVLVKHTYTGGQEFLRISRNNSKDIVNLTARFGLALSQVHFASESVLYGTENGNLRKLDLGGSSLSEPIAKQVVSFKLYGDKDIALVRHVEGRYRVAVSIAGADLKLVATYDDTLPVMVDISKYFNERYVAITRGASFELVKNPEKTEEHGFKKLVTLTYPGNVQWLDMSANGRFVIAGIGTQFMTYDIELEQRSDVSLPGNPSDTTRPLQWLDDHILVSTADNKIRMSDFDGDNQQIIVDALPAQPVTLSPDQTLLYSFSKTQSGKVALQVSKMTVNN